MEQDEFDLKIKQDFISEALEMLGWVEDQFLIFEQNPNDSKVVDEIFRMAHTVKGSAMTCGFERLGEFAHVMETLLVMIREGKHAPDSETVDVLLRANDTLKAYLELLRNDFDAVLNTDSIKEDLMYFIGDEVKPSGGPAMTGFGFFDDDEPSEAAPSPAPAVSADAEPRHSPQTPSMSSAYASQSTHDDSSASPLEELSFLSLKAYLELSRDSSPQGIEACLRTLEEVMHQLSEIREN